MVVNRLNIAILPNLNKPHAELCSKRVASILTSYGANCLSLKNGAFDIYDKTVYFCDSLEDMLCKSDIVVAIGGDGTIIYVAKAAAKFGKPVLGVNLGRLGFVAGLEVDELKKLRYLVEGKYSIEDRMMLSVEIVGDGATKKLVALNDAVVSRGALSRIVDLNVRLNDSNMFMYRADGLIVSTPTGSTAYSLSAGGPVIDPKMRSVLLTPICPHSLFARPILFGETSCISIQPVVGDNTEVFLTIDGQESTTIGPSDMVSICASNMNAKIIKMNNKDFYQILNDKLSKGKCASEK